MTYLPLKNFKPSEKDITREIRAYLKIRGIFHWKAWQGLGSTPGCPDILGIWKGKMLGIEVKGGRGYLTEIQQQFIDRINTEGGVAFVARSVDDVETHLK
jgi:Holliday junction resolvase